MITTSLCLQQDHRTIVNNVIQNNSYFAHQENLLFAMLTDDNATVREFGYIRVIKARDNTPKNLRRFEKPKLLMNAEQYHIMD